MSERQNILNQIVTDAKAAFVSGNGYTNTLKDAKIGYVQMQSGSEFDTMYILAGQDVPLRYTNNNTPVLQEIEIWLIMQIKSSAGVGKIDTAIETWVTDIRNFIYQGSGITTNKWLTLNNIPLPVSSYVWSSLRLGTIESYPADDENDSFAQITFPVKVQYQLTI